MSRFASFIVITSLLYGCSNDHRPAPVSTAGLYNESNKGRLKSDFYTVKPGDTLYSIAWLANLDPNTLARINNIPQPYTIFLNQELHLNSDHIKSKKVAKKTTNTKNGTKNNQKSVTHAKKTDKKQIKSGRNVKKTVKELEHKKNKAYSGVSGNKSKEKVSPPKNVIHWLWPTAGNISEQFSSAENGNKGVNIFGKRGQTVTATADGVVVYAGNALRGYGKLLIIKHDNNYLSAYAHNSMLKVHEGDTVTAGQHIALMGSSDAPRDMLHFEIRYRGKSVNPEKYLFKR